MAKIKDHKKLKDYTTDITVGQDGHTYSLLTGKRLHSPSYILRPLMNIIFSDYSNRNVAARERGKDVAGSIEAFEKYNERVIEPENEIYFDTYLKAKKEIGFTVLENEYHVVDYKNHTHGYIDIVGTLNGKIIAIEIKTRKALKINSTDLIQNLVYKKAFPVPFYGLILTDTGEYLFEEMKFDNRVESELQTLRNFRAMLGNAKVAGDVKK